MIARKAAIQADKECAVAETKAMLSGRIAALRGTVHPRVVAEPPHRSARCNGVPMVYGHCTEGARAVNVREWCVRY